jgi:hypothetical protein
MKTMKLMMGCMFILMMAAVVMAADPMAPPAGMPEMGPPAEMKQIATLEGTWDIVSKFNMSMDASAAPQWMESKAVAVFSYVCDGAAMACDYSGDAMMPGMAGFKGHMMQAWDRELKQWQATWVDNMSGRISFYTGTDDGKQMVMTGEDRMMGQAFLSRMTVFNRTPTSYDWKMEASMDNGKTWMESGTAKYTKRK